MLRLPESLPATPTFVWQQPLTNQGLGGVAATDSHVVVVDRDPADTTDVFHCFDATTGAERWTLRYPAPGNLDYGNSPRATPLIDGDLVYLFGAFGTLTCAKLDDGAIVWRRDLLNEFNVTEPLVWGFASSPLLVDEKLIVNPGGTAAALAALDPKTGDTIWQTPGEPAAFASFVVGAFGGVRQFVGYDKTSLGGWDIASGRRLWKLTPAYPDDFNVPTPLVVGEKLLVSTENNGTRLYKFDDQGRIIARPVAVNEELAPDTHTPVAVGGRLFGVWRGFHCLDLEHDLKTVYRSDDTAFNDYATIIADDRRLLVTTQAGELLLLDADAHVFRIVSRLKLFDGDSGVFSHPALVGDRLYVRAADRITCLRLTPDADQ